MSASQQSPRGEDAERRQQSDLIHRLELHRHRLDMALSPDHGPGGRGFPRSHTMRLILGEPLLMAALSALAMRLFGRKLARSVPIALATIKVVTSVVRESRCKDSSPSRPDAREW